MRLKPRKKKAKRLSYRKNWKSCSTTRTKVRLPLPFLQPSSALRSLFEAASETVTGAVSVRLAFSCVAVAVAVVRRTGEGDYHLPFVDVSLPFEHYEFPFGDHAQPSSAGPTVESSDGARERHHLRARPFCRSARCLGFPQRFGSHDFRYRFCFRASPLRPCSRLL